MFTHTVSPQNLATLRSRHSVLCSDDLRFGCTAVAAEEDADADAGERASSGGSVKTDVDCESAGGEGCEGASVTEEEE